MARRAPVQASAVAFGVPELAHELNSLLDGTLRSMRLADEAMSASATGDDAATARALEWLRTAQRGVGEAVEVVRRALGGAASVTELLHSPRSIEDEAARVVEAVGPLAARHGVEVRLEIDDRAGPLAAGPLGSVLMNGVSNAVQACAASGRSRGRVEVAISISPGGSDLVMSITDDGAGFRAERPHGHGLGLAICRRILDSLGGSLDLANVAFGTGAVLHARIPLRSLESR